MYREWPPQGSTGWKKTAAKKERGWLLFPLYFLNAIFPCGFLEEASANLYARDYSRIFGTGILKEFYLLVEYQFNLWNVKNTGTQFQQQHPFSGNIFSNETNANMVYRAVSKPEKTLSRLINHIKTQF